MSFADGAQIMVGPVVYEKLNCRERYMDSFRAFPATVKHGSRITLYQFREEGHDGVSVAVPSQFAQKKAKERVFTDEEAYFMAFAIKHEEFVAMFGPGLRDYAAAVAFYFMAHDAVATSHARHYETPWLRTRGKGDLPFPEVFDYYMSCDFNVCFELANFIHRQMSYVAEFSDETYSSKFFFVNDDGKKKLQRERPDICGELDI